VFESVRLNDRKVEVLGTGEPTQASACGTKLLGLTIPFLHFYLPTGRNRTYDAHEGRWKSATSVKNVSLKRKSTRVQIPPGTSARPVVQPKLLETIRLGKA